MTTVYGGGGQTKRQADGGEAIRGEREQARAREGEGPGKSWRGGTGGPGQLTRTGKVAH